MTRPPPGLRAAYRRFHPVPTRWMDNDVFGHVNNAHYYSYFDTAITAFEISAGVLHQAGAGHIPGNIMVVAESGCRYHSELSFPDLVTIGLRVARLGGASVRYELAAFRGDADAASAEGFMVHVCVDAQTRRPAPLPDAWRAALQTVME